MMMTKRALVRFVAATVFGFAHAGTALAQNYPNRPIKMIVPFPAGGPTDFMARLIADRLSAALGQTIVVENRGGGGGGSVGAKAVATADPDGYTLLLTPPGPLSIAPAVYRKLDYDPVKDFVPIALLIATPLVLTVNPALPVHSLPELVAYARTHPGQISLGTQGYGTAPHLLGELLKLEAGIDIVHVPYRGTAPAITDLISSHVDLMFTEMASAIELHKSGRAHILAVSAHDRSPLLPDIPTVIEAGVPDFISDTWNAISAPPRTSPAIVAKLNAAIVEVLKMPDVQEKLKKINTSPQQTTLAQAAKVVKDDTARWAAVIKAADLKPAE